MTITLDTLGKCARHGMVLQIECECGNRAFFLASDLAMIVHPGRDPRAIRFRCESCQPKRPSVTILEIDRDWLPKMRVRRPVYIDGLRHRGWTTERLK